MSSAGFETATPATKRPQTYALDRAATEVGEAYLNINNSVRTSKWTPHFTITKIDWLMLFKEKIAAYSENNAKPKK
jgi:hypothetical protein